MGVALKLAVLVTWHNSSIVVETVFWTATETLYSRRWGEFRMQVIAYKVWLLIRYKYTMEFQKILLSLFRVWSVSQKLPMRAENFFA